MALLAALSLASAHANPLSLGQAAGYNVFVFNNFTEYNTDAQGTMAVGGNFAPSNGGSFTIAGAMSNGAGTYDLVVGGNFTMANNSMGGGDLYVGGNLTWNDPSLPHNAYVVGSVSNTGGGSAGGTIYHEGSYSGPSYISNQQVASGSIPTPINFLSAQTSLDSLSTTLAGETPNGIVTSAYGTYTLTGTSSGINIFNLTDSSYSGATINITAPAGSTVIINVAGTADSFSGGSINLNGITNNDVIFNFNAATSLSVGSMAFNGTILAPFANVTGNFGQIDGELIALSDAGTTQLNDEVFNGNLGNAPDGNQISQTLQATTPEPSTWLMLTGGLCALLLAGRKHRLA
jgi:choice-of-anchor A domain-containing protein